VPPSNDRTGTDRTGAFPTGTDQAGAFPTGAFPTGAFQTGAFQTDPDALHALAAALVRAQDSLQDALDALGATTAAAVGTGGLDRACHDFQQHWSGALGQLRQQLADTAEGLRRAATGYAATERELAARFGAQR
jgi:uncharacterized protein YukE